MNTQSNNIVSFESFHNAKYPNGRPDSDASQDGIATVSHLSERRDKTDTRWATTPADVAYTEAIDAIPQRHFDLFAPHDDNLDYLPPSAEAPTHLTLVHSAEAATPAGRRKKAAKRIADLLRRP